MYISASTSKIFCSASLPAIGAGSFQGISPLSDLPAPPTPTDKAAIAIPNTIFLNISCSFPSYYKNTSAKSQVRHILFKKICYSIFLNNPLTVHGTIVYYLKRKNNPGAPGFSFSQYDCPVIL